MEIRILLFPIDRYDRRRDAEFIENSVYDIHGLETAIPNDVGVLTLSEFMDLCNDQEFDIENYWVSYVRYDKK
jgi:hypothetical protein